MLGEYYILKYSPNTTRHIRGRCVECVHCVQGINPLFCFDLTTFSKRNVMSSLTRLTHFFSKVNLCTHAQWTIGDLNPQRKEFIRWFLTKASEQPMLCAPFTVLNEWISKFDTWLLIHPLKWGITSNYSTKKNPFYNSTCTILYILIVYYCPKSRIT